MKRSENIPESLKCKVTLEWADNCQSVGVPPFNIVVTLNFAIFQADGN